VERLFAVIRSKGPRWNHSVALEQQEGWAAHAEFMNGLQAEGFVVMGGGLEGSPDFLLIFRAADADEIRSRLAADPWGPEQLAMTRISPWTLLLGSLADEAR
jgi:hypothetical protein